MKIELYHGTSVESADLIMQHGFKDRVGAGKGNWEKRVLSKAGFVYLTTAYPFFFAMNASKGKMASVVKVSVDTDDLYPDEDLFFFKFGNMFKVSAKDLLDMKHLADESLQLFGNVAVKPEAVEVLGRRDFKVGEMMYFSDPSISPINYKILGGYYRKLTDTWWDGGEWQKVDQSAELYKSINQKK